MVSVSPDVDRERGDLQVVDGHRAPFVRVARLVDRTRRKPAMNVTFVTWQQRPAGYATSAESFEKGALIFRVKASTTALDVAVAADPLLAAARRSWRWYERTARRARRRYEALEVFQIGTGAMIPLATAVHWPIAVGAALGAGIAIAIAGGIGSDLRWQSNWVACAVTAGNTQHEISLYTAKIQPYNNGNGGQRLVSSVARLEMIETMQWAMQAQHNDQSQATTAPANGKSRS
jgi:hypothetical protein